MGDMSAVVENQMDKTIGKWNGQLGLRFRVKGIGFRVDVSVHSD